MVALPRKVGKEKRGGSPEMSNLSAIKPLFIEYLLSIRHYDKCWE